MIRVELPGIPQAEFEDAFAVLRECTVTTLPCHGFTRPFMGPGGAYGSCWWERDSALTLSGWRWVDQHFAENVLLDFADVQKENGRIPLWGNDRVEDYDEQLSAIPLLFEVALKTLRRTRDKALIRRVYEMLCRYMDWWLSPVKRDPVTGLAAGIFEESDPSDIHDQGVSAQVDLNVQLCVGADVLAELAGYLEEYEQRARWQQVFAELRAAVNRWLYDPADGLYYPYLLREKRLQAERVYNAMFDVFKRRILPADRAERLLAYLQDDANFGYGSPYGLTTMAKHCGQYTETVGVYQGYTSWSGNIWTLRNEIIISGLREYGLREQSAHLAWQTVREFSGNYAEFMNPRTGEGHGVQRYGWTASQYIQLIIEELFGVDDNVWTDTLTVSPNLPAELTGQTVRLFNLPLRSGRFLHVTACRTESMTEVRPVITDGELDAF